MLKNIDNECPFYKCKVHQEIESSFLHNFRFDISGFGDSEISRSDIYRLDFTSAGQSQMLIDILKEIDVGR